MFKYRYLLPLTPLLCTACVQPDQEPPICVLHQDIYIESVYVDITQCKKPVSKRVVK